MGGCVDKQKNIKQVYQPTKRQEKDGQNENKQKREMRESIDMKNSKRQKYILDLNNKEQKLIETRNSRIEADIQKEESLRNKLELIKARKYDQAGIKPQNSYFQMMKIQKQLQLYKKKIQKQKEEVQKIQLRKTQRFG